MYTYGDPRDATCQRRVGFFVEKAFGNQSPHEASSFTCESMPMSRRFFVMIWFDATQSDQPEMTWMFSWTGFPFGSSRVSPLYVNPASVSVFFAAVGLYVAICAASFFTAGSVTQSGKSPEPATGPDSPTASAGGSYPYSPSFHTVLRSIAWLTALRNANRLYGYCVSSNTREIG